MSKKGERLESTHCLELQSQILIWARTKEVHADGECLAFRASLRACIACRQSNRLSEASIWNKTHWELAGKCSIDQRQMSENTLNMLGARWVWAEITFYQRVRENASALTRMRIFWPWHAYVCTRMHVRVRAWYCVCARTCACICAYVNMYVRMRIRAFECVWSWCTSRVRPLFSNSALLPSRARWCKGSNRIALSKLDSASFVIPASCQTVISVMSRLMRKIEKTAG